MSMLDKFMDEFDDLLKKHLIDDVILVNFDDNQMGFRQLIKISETEQFGRCLVLSFSGKGEILCPCCAGKEKNCNEKDCD